MKEFSVMHRVFRRGRILGVTLLCLTALFCNGHAALNPTDSDVLKQLGSAWGVKTLRWGSGDPCTWPGVDCDATGTTVIKLLLQAGSISGPIPAAIGSFTGLQELDLSFNTGLVGPIPSEIGQLSSLTSLIIQACSLIGPVPASIGNLTKLEFIGLNNNNLTGGIPSALGALPSLYWFDLSTNNLTGELPVSTTSANGFGLDTLDSCQHFHFNNNSLSGGLPSELGAPKSGPTRLTKLVHLLLENNQFSGPIPASIANLSSLEILSLSNNKLTGPIPASLNTYGASSRLQQILVGSNQLQGVIPNLTAVTTNLTVVDFSNNAFDPQPFPTWIQNAPIIQTVSLEGCNLTGEFPSEVLSAPHLQTLWARNNALNGTLTIPAVLGSNLETISMQDNEFSLVTQTDANTNTTQIDLQVMGNPTCTATNLARPSGLCDEDVQAKQPWASSYLLTTNGTATTNCPTQKCSDTTTTNPLLPGNCNCLQPLEMQLEARHPGFSVLTNELMDTLRDQLSSQLNLLSSQVWITTAAFTADGRCLINVDFFAANGVSALDRATMSNVTHSLTSNSLLLPTIKPYLGHVLVDGATSLASQTTLSGGAIAGIVVGCLAALFAVCIYAIWQRRRAQRLKHRAQPFAKWGGGEGEKDVAAPNIAGTRFFTFSEIRKFTNTFANEIGVGGYGKVYSGVLDNGVQVAVKRAQEGSMQGAEEFKNEIELLSRVHHKNLLGLVGYCYGHGEQMLVYEFMVNGTVREWLAGKMAYPLDWTKRLSIALGSARGLAYLHELADPPIIHRDIKSQNILLDEKHIAKVADFGLSKLAPEGTDKQIVTDQVKGTMGYLDPEYYRTQHLSAKSDVYSFGVVLLELATSWAPIQGGKYIVREVRTALQDGGMEALEELLDPSVYEASQQDLDRFIDLALTCVEDKGEHRPTMNEVVRELETLAQHNRPKAKASAHATDPSWLTDVYGDDDYNSAEHGTAATNNFLYSGGYSPGHPEPK